MLWHWGGGLGYRVLVKPVVLDSIHVGFLYGEPWDLVTFKKRE